jgi:hypothetical protein
MDTNTTYRYVVMLSLFLLSLTLVNPTSVMADSIRESISGDLDVRAYYNEVGGNENLSFMTEGPNVLTDLYFYYDDKIGQNDGIQLSGELYLQGTDDPQYQIRNDEIRLQNIFLTAEKQNEWKFTGGYYSERYTQYTMNSVLLGLNGWLQLSENARLRAFAGRANRARPGNKLRRFAGGSRLEYTPFENQMLAVSYVQTEDDEDSLDGTELNGVDTFSNSVTSIDYEGEFESQNLTVSGEWATSDFDSEPAGGGSSIDGEVARKAELRWRPVEITEFSGKYEEVDPGFNTLSGFATTDRKSYRLNWNQVVTESINFQSQYEKWNDGLESNTQNDVTRWEVDARWTPTSNDNAYWRKELAVLYESRENEGADPGLDDGGANDSDEHLWDLELWNQFGKNELIIGYNWDENALETTVREEWTMNFSRRFEKLGFTESTSVEIPLSYYLNTSYKEDQDDQGSTSEVDRSVRIDNQVILAEGRREEISLSHGYLNEHSDGDQEIITESYGVSYSRIINRELGTRISLSYDFTDNRDKGDSSQEYDEEQIQARFTTSF